jgi:hypothetical protein
MNQQIQPSGFYKTYFSEESLSLLKISVRKFKPVKDICKNMT